MRMYNENVCKNMEPMALIQVENVFRLFGFL